MATVRLTTAQALVRFLAAQFVERDGQEERFFHGCLGIFGHGNLAGIGQALQQEAALLRYYQVRNEQAAVHVAAGYARMKNRLAAMACTSSIGPGATNMVTGAALATINRLPVLLLPGDVFASHVPDPVLQQLEVPSRGDVSVNDCLIPVSRYFDRIMRPEQLAAACLNAVRVLTSQAETGAVTLAMPQDVQTEALDFPEELFARRVWPVRRPLPDRQALEEAAAMVRAARQPLIVAGGGVIYSEASEALARLVEATGIPVCETQAGKGSLPHGSPGLLGAVGATGTSAANRVAARADLVIGVGTRWSDFTTASRSAFRTPGIRFVTVNVAVLVTPNNPTALSVDRPAVLELARRLAEHRCRLIVDESFIEFSRSGRMASVEGDVDDHPNLVIIKSMSKVFGVAGLRIGYLLTADRRFAAAVRAHLERAGRPVRVRCDALRHRPPRARLHLRQL